MSATRVRAAVAYASVAYGAAAGALARWLVASWLPPGGPGFPWATLVVNAAGSLLIGLLAGLVARHRLVSVHLQLALMTGFCGGFTTFSAFGLETLLLLQEGRVGVALANILVSVVLWLVAVWAGYRIGTQGRWGRAR